MTTEINTAEMSLADLKAHIARLEQEAVNASREVARPLVEHLLTTNVVKPSTAKGSCWVGFKADTFEITVEGTTYKVGVIVTDVAATEAREQEKAAAEKEAKKQEQVGPLLAKLAELQAAGVTIPNAS